MSQASFSNADSLIGTTLAGRYRIEARVGSGAMGAVYRAEQTGLGRRVALKIVNRGKQVDYDTIQRFRREATALSALHHPNTVRVFDFGTTPAGLFYLAMELLEGEPLTARMFREKPLPLAIALSVTQQVLRSIGEAHARGIVHRDLKPDNIYLARVQNEPEPIVKVLDFGIAKAVAGAGTINQFETLDGTVFGTPRYMSPEQAGGRALDARSDLYSVGIMLYELIAGNPPFVDGDAVVVMARHIRDKPAPLSKAVPMRGIPASLEAVVTRSLAKNPTERFQTADDFERAVERCKSEITGQAQVPFANLRGVGRARFVWPAVAGIALAASGGALLYAWQLRTSAAESSAQTAPIETRETTESAAHSAVTAQDLQAVTRMVDPSELIHEGAAQARAREIERPGRADLPAEDRPENPSGGMPDPDMAEAEIPNVVSVQTAPPAAAVLQDGSELGVTPLDVAMNKGSTLTLTLKKRGFAAQKLELKAEDGTRVVTLRRLTENDRIRERERLNLGVRHPHDPAATAEPAPTPVAPLAPASGPSGQSSQASPTTSPSSSLDRRSPYERF